MDVGFCISLVVFKVMYLVFFLECVGIFFIGFNVKVLFDILRLLEIFYLLFYYLYSRLLFIGIEEFV